MKMRIGLIDEGFGGGFGWKCENERIVGFLVDGMFFLGED